MNGFYRTLDGSWTNAETPWPANLAVSVMTALFCSALELRERCAAYAGMSGRQYDLIRIAFQRNITVSHDGVSLRCGCDAPTPAEQAYTTIACPFHWDPRLGAHYRARHYLYALEALYSCKT